MASKTSISALFLTVNLLFFALVTSSSTQSVPASCPPPTCSLKNPLTLGVCTNLLGGISGIIVGIPPTSPCCPLIRDLVDLDAAVCLCLAIEANVLHILNLSADAAITLILNKCGKSRPEGYSCKA